MRKKLETLQNKARENQRKADFYELEYEDALRMESYGIKEKATVIARNLGEYHQQGSPSTMEDLDLLNNPKIVYTFKNDQLTITYASSQECHEQIPDRLTKNDLVDVHEIVIAAANEVVYHHESSLGIDRIVPGHWMRLIERLYRQAENVQRKK